MNVKLKGDVKQLALEEMWSMVLTKMRETAECYLEKDVKHVLSVRLLQWRAKSVHEGRRSSCKSKSFACHCSRIGQENRVKRFLASTRTRA